MLPISSLKSMNVLFATPCYISAVAMNYVTSIFSMTCDAMHLGLGCTLHMHSESLITRGRNNIVRKFLAEEKFTHLFQYGPNIIGTINCMPGAAVGPVPTPAPRK
jgi:hypothetical protein